MKTKPLTVLLALTFLFLFSGSVYGDDLQDGLDAYERKDYKEAFRLWKPLAEQGHADIQRRLGYMYETGQGLPQHYKEAVRLYRLSAEQGDASAQYNLGMMYLGGKGVPKHYVIAHMWFNLSTSNGYALGRTRRNMVEKKMTPEQIEKAQDMAINW